MVELLFVDDESRVLDGLRRMLISEQRGWQLHFAPSGREALELLERHVIDVVVTDMRMPEMDGAALLAEVSSRYPGTVRIVLSGHADSDAALRAMTAAHQYLAKPCERATLVSVIERALALRPLLGNPRMREVLHRVGTLPPIPQSYAQVVRILNSPDCSLEQIQDVVRKDSGLAGKVLHLANSSYFGRSGSMTNLTAAIGMLGTKMLRNLVLTAEIAKDLGSIAPDIGLSVEALQEHCIAVAEVASRLEPGAAWCEDAYLAGLLHDMGLLVMATRLPEEYRRVEAECIATGQTRMEVERRLMGCHQGDIGAYLFSLWGLPAAIVEAVSAHADLTLEPHEPLNAVRAVALAEELVGAVQSLDGSAAQRTRFSADPRWADWLERAQATLARKAA
jgi:HD-like signal output (HDOD) protein/CheY-like chemotaxis protein